MSQVELRQLVGKYLDPQGKARRVGWNMDQLLLNGRQISTINRVPGAPIRVDVALTPSERKAVEDAIAAQRGGQGPSKIVTPSDIAGMQLLDDEEDEEAGADLETEVDGE